MARTDSLQKEGLNGVIDRISAYVEAGADAIFAEAMTDITMYRKGLRRRERARAGQYHRVW
jgi:methylisocitrate lyase